MKKINFLCLFLIAATTVRAQTYQITWGDEIKLKKGTADLDIVAADNTGLYFTEARLKMKSYFLIGASYGSAYKLYKVDKNFSEVFDKEYKKELKGLEFHSFQSLDNDLYMFATDYDKKEKLFRVLGAKIDKNTGDLAAEFTELGSYQLESKKDDYEMKMTPIRNGTAFLMVSNISGKDRVSLGVNLLDKSFHKKESAIINLSFDPGRFSLQDVKLTSDNKIILLGKEFEEVQIPKKKRPRITFKQYVLSIYDNKGKKEKDVSLESGSRFVINGRLVEQAGGDLLLAGFYSNSAKKDDLNGFFINKIDVKKGELTLSSFKEINSGMLGKNFIDESEEDDDSKENKKQAAKSKDKDEEDELPNEFIIRSVDINPADNSIIITSEVSQYSYYTYTSSSYNSSLKRWETTRYNVHRFTNQDILVINADKDGNIRWLNAIPKSQSEEIRTSSTNSGMIYFSSDLSGYFAGGGAMPYYSSFASLMNNKNLVILMNDHTSNNVNPEYGTRVKTVTNFRKKSNIYGISIDLATGKMTRKFIASNNDETILMPRLGYVVKNELYLPSWRQHAMAKTELKFAKIVAK
jgi:hypothetical protein